MTLASFFIGSSRLRSRRRPAQAGPLAIPEPVEDKQRVIASRAEMPVVCRLRLAPVHGRFRGFCAPEFRPQLAVEIELQAPFFCFTRKVPHASPRNTANAVPMRILAI